MKGVARAVLDRLIDYAGLFPPAGLSMTEAVGAYAAYQRRPDAWALGRFVVPVSRLEEFERAVAALPERERLGTRWPLTALLGPELRAEMARVESFNERYVHAGPEVLSLEARAANASEIAAICAVVPAAFDLYLEIPPGPGLPPLLQEIGERGARAKVRTGGTKAMDIPTPESVMGFLTAAAEAGVPFKATAGLHHPVRGLAPLTYLPGSECATMYGYLNLLLAATLLWHGRPAEDGHRILCAIGRGDLELGESEISWEGVRIEAEEIVRTRDAFVIAIGSCSFTEPVEEIEAA